MGFTCIEIRNYTNIKVLCVIMYLITDIVVENFSRLFSKISIHENESKNPKLNSVPDF